MKPSQPTSLPGHLFGRRFARGAAAGVLSAMLLATPVMYALADTPPQVRSNSSTQMSSNEEVVYVNTLNDASARTQNFNANWKFNLGEASGAHQMGFDDSSWQHVNLPHDYSIDREYTENGEAESGYKLGGTGWYRKSFNVGEEMRGKRVRIDFDGVYMDSTVWINGQELGGHPNGYTQFSFDLTPYLKFGEENSLAVSVNHQTPSSRWYSGSGIGRDVMLTVSGPVHVAKDGMVVSSPDLETNRQSVPTKIFTTVRNDGEAPATVQLVQRIFKRGGSPDQAIGTQTTDAIAIPAGSSQKIESTVTAANPELWSTRAANLYTVRCEVKIDGRVVDTYDVDYGYRYFKFDADAGFSLNGEALKIKGVCLHHDQGPLGSVSTRAALERQVKIMKDMGANSIRTSHNAPSRALIEICNEQGILIDEEFFDGWSTPKNENGKDYARFFKQKMGSSKLIGADPEKTWAQFDLEQGIARDINDPSVILWSLGNEMTEYAGAMPDFNQIQQNLFAWAKAADPTRPATTGDNKFKGGSAELNPSGVAAAGGIVGFNYMAGSRYDEVHRNHRDWKIYGSETASAVNSRGIYNVLGGNNDNYIKDDTTKQLTSYDRSRVSWGHTASEAWYDTVKRDFVAGEYIWTGFDYLGEPTPWNGTAKGRRSPWPSPKNSYFGIVDTAGLPKDSYYLYQSQWNDSKRTLHVLPAWNKDVVSKDNSGKVPVVVYTDAPDVELEFTSKATGQTQKLGRKKFTKKTSDGGRFTYQLFEGTGADRSAHKNLYLTWMVPFEEGTITAKAYDESGRPIDTSNADEWDGRQSVTTTGPAAKLTAQADRTRIAADGADLSYVTIDVRDAQGNIVPNAAQKVTVKVEGGTLAGLDNGNAPDHQSFRDDNRCAFSGQLVAIVRSGKKAGAIKVTATADNLQAATAHIDAQAVPGSTDQAKAIESLLYSRYQYVKKGSTLALPEKVIARYTDGTQSELAVAWDAVPEGKLNENGSFALNGRVGDTSLTMNVTVLEDVAALLNYSTTVQKGASTVALPTARPAVLPDATVINASFPVRWQMPKASAFAEEGTVEIPGTASVFGKDVTVHATVRVQDEQIKLGDNVAPAALKLEQSLTVQSDTLGAITDGKKDHKVDNADGKNRSCWTNYHASQANTTTADIIFTYATQQRFGEATVYFFRDNWSARWPKPNTVKLFVSEDGTRWEELATTERIGEAAHEGNRVKPYTYTFTPVVASYVKLSLTNSDEQLSNNIKPCTGITEVELRAASGFTTVNDDAALKALTVNGQKVPANVIDSGEFSTRAIMAEVKAVGRGNAAVTVLPPYESALKIIMEGGDHAHRATFTIHLGAEGESQDLEANDASRDYPVNKITPTAGSEQRGVGAVQKAFDGRESTHFHSSWSAPKPTRDDMWLKMELDEPTEVEALRYLPRQDSGDGSQNGIVTKYVVEWSADDATWDECAEGDWPGTEDRGWHVAQFTKPVTAKYFRIKAVDSLSNNPADVYMSAAEQRLREARPTVDIADAAQVNVELPAKVVLGRVDARHPLDALKLDEELTSNSKALVYGVDYLMTFEDADTPGEATVIIEGIGTYSGTVTRKVQIEVQLRIAGIAVKDGTPAKRVYRPDEEFDPAGLVLNATLKGRILVRLREFDPAGLVLNATMSDDSMQQIALSDANAAEFSFDPAVGTKLPAGQTVEVAVTYQGMRATFMVSVAAKAPQPAPGGNTGNGGNAGSTGSGGNAGSTGSGSVDISGGSAGSGGVDISGGSAGSGGAAGPQEGGGRGDGASAGSSANGAPGSRSSSTGGKLVHTGDASMLSVGFAAIAGSMALLASLGARSLGARRRR